MFYPVVRAIWLMRMYRRVAKRVVAERYGPDKKVRGDMLGSFVRHGLTQREAESESLLQMYQ